VPRPTLRALALTAAVVAGLAGCGDSGGQASAGSPATKPSPRLVDFSKRPPFVNSLDIDAATGDFLLTTNRGFWRIDPETDAVEPIKATINAPEGSSPVGTFLDVLSRGPGRLLGSGHPDDKDVLPPFLGLIESDDGGVTWRVISRLGDADLHKMVVKHNRFYAFDAVLGAILISQDGGRTFEEQFTPPSLIIDFDVDPSDPERIFASSERQLFRSEDGAASWRGVDRAEGIRLAWPAPDAFYRAERDGVVKRSRDGGGSWQEVGRVPGEPYKFKATGPESLFLALSDGTIVATEDGGRTWTEEFRP
jgi:photosystem II stability/assembly factor-like uncharacterized protein